MRKSVIEKKLAEIKEKIRNLDKESPERRFRKFFYDEEAIEERLMFEKDRKDYFEELPENADGHELMRVLERDLKLDFTIVNFSKIFMRGNLNGFVRTLLKDEKELADVPYYRVQFVNADEQSGEISYRIGIYA